MVRLISFSPFPLFLFPPSPFLPSRLLSSAHRFRFRAVYHLETGRLHNLHITVSPPEDDDEEWVAGEKRARRGSQIERERLEDARLSALLSDLKIPEHKENADAAKTETTEEPQAL